MGGIGWVYDMNDGSELSGGRKGHGNWGECENEWQG